MERTRNATTRRRFLGTAAGATGAALAASVLQPAAAAAATTPVGRGAATAGVTGRTFAGAHFGIALDGTPEGLVQTADGGDGVGEVIVMPVGTDGVQRKHIGGVKYEDFTVTADFGLAPDFYGWIENMVQNSPVRHNGQVQSADFNYAVKAIREFTNALITEVTVPACDASSKATGYLSVSFAPEVARDAAPTGSIPKAAKSKPWLCSNFRLEIDGLDCTHVNKIDAITIKQKIATNPIGESRDFQGEPAGVEYPNLVVTLSASTVATWKTWFESFVIAGQCTANDEKNGKLTLLASDLKTELAVLQLHHMGIFRLDPDPEPGGTDALARAHAELYVDQMNFSKLGTWMLT